MDLKQQQLIWNTQWTNILEIFQIFPMIIRLVIGMLDTVANPLQLWTFKTFGHSFLQDKNALRVANNSSIILKITIL